MASYAKLEITLITLIGATVTAAVGFFFGWWALLPGILALSLLAFYRDPPRRITPGDNLVLSAADGRIMNVERDFHVTPDAPAELRITIFLSVANVHINRAPCAGTVTGLEYNPGEFLNALKSEATTRNENNLVTFKPKAPLPGPILVRQIAGVLAKRVVCTAEPGDELAAGERFGMIKLGSQTEVRMPEDPRWEVAVRPKQPVRAGVTVLTRLKT